MFIVYICKISKLKKEIDKKYLNAKIHRMREIRKIT